MNTLQNLLTPYTGTVPGAALLVLQDGRPVVTEVRGYADLEAGREVTPKTNFRLASVSKHFTASGILKLIEKKELSLEKTVSDIVPDFPEYGKRITIYHLLTHTSGLPDYEELMKARNIEEVRDRDILKLYKAEAGTVSTPGEKFAYSDGGYCILACIVEKVSGATFPEFMRSELFVSLGMNTTYVNDEGITVIPERAYGYSRVNNAWIRTDQNATSRTMGDGGVYSSLEDLVIWDEYVAAQPDLYTSRVLTDQEPKPVKYSFGFFRRMHEGDELQYHRGSSIGFRTGYLRVPGKKISIIFLSNRNEGNGNEVCELVLKDR